MFFSKRDFSTVSSSSRCCDDNSFLVFILLLPLRFKVAPEGNDRDDLKLRMKRCIRVAANPHVERCCKLLHPGSFSRVPVNQLRLTQCEPNRLLLARREHDPLESFQLAHGPRRVTESLVYVKLCDLLTRTSACVFYVYRHFHWRTTPPHHRVVYSHVRVTEARVAQPVAEWIERRGWDVPVARLESWLRLGFLCEVASVVDGDLT